MSKLPDFIASAQPNPFGNRVGWLTTTAATYAGVMLWFVFWQDVPVGTASLAGGVLSQGLLPAILSVVAAAFVCHYLFYLAPAMFGMQTGLPLAVVGTSTFGSIGGFLMPGLLMGCLQFGWLSVNAYFSGMLLAGIAAGYGVPALATNIGGFELNGLHMAISIVWILLAFLIGLKGIRYVGAVASVAPILPLGVLAYLLYKTYGGVADFSVEKLMAAAPADAKAVSLYGSGNLGVLAVVTAYIAGFFATAGAAGCDFGSNNRSSNAVRLAGLVGVFGATAFTGVAALLIVAGAQSTLIAQGASPEMLSTFRVTDLFTAILGKEHATYCTLALVIAAFPSACFPTFIAANCIKTAFPKVNPWFSCGIGVIVAIALVLTKAAGQAVDVFTVIGASFGPICGAMFAEYISGSGRWSGPRRGVNPAGWLAWLAGFAVGASTLIVTKFMGQTMPFEIPCPPMAAFIVGFIVYDILAALGIQTSLVEMPQRIDNKDATSIL
ncbi:MAG: hypothetical protein ACRC46_10515 [Thermoguttaceae bacterium]